MLLGEEKQKQVFNLRFMCR